MPPLCFVFNHESEPSWGGSREKKFVIFSGISVALIVGCTVPDLKWGVNKLENHSEHRICSAWNAALNRGGWPVGKWGGDSVKCSFCLGLVKHFVSFFCSRESCIVHLA